MADTRMIRKAIRNSDAFCTLDWFARDVYIGLLLYADDYGLYDARPKILRAELYALMLDKVRESDLQRALENCERAGLVRFYSVDGKPYLHVQKYGQRCQSQPKYPVPPGYEVERLSKTEYALKESPTKPPEPTVAHGESQKLTAYTESESESNNKTTLYSAREKCPDGCPESAGEVVSYMGGLLHLGLRGEELDKCANAFFDEGAACGWVNKRGLPIRDWRAAARDWVRKWMDNLTSRARPMQSPRNNTQQTIQDDYKL